jgi:hypothetical protein
MLKYIFLLLIPNFAFAITVNPTPFPVFLKAGYSTILEFEDIPIRVVLGDSQSFQVEKLDRSIVIKTLASYANTNMFVYFKTKDPRLFVLTASEDAEPTYYKKFETIAPPPAKKVAIVYKKSAKLLSAQFSTKKDYLTVEIVVSAGAEAKLLPQWNKVRLAHNTDTLSPDKLWSERKEVQKDSNSKARFIFHKPNLPRDRKNTRLIIPLHGSSNPLVISLAGRLP